MIRYCSARFVFWTSRYGKVVVGLAGFEPTIRQSAIFEGRSRLEGTFSNPKNCRIALPFCYRFFTMRF